MGLLPCCEGLAEKLVCGGNATFRPERVSGVWHARNQHHATNDLRAVARGLAGMRQSGLLALKCLLQNKELINL
jgi:hypothetical protein